MRYRPLLIACAFLLALLVQVQHGWGKEYSVTATSFEDERESALLPGSAEPADSDGDGLADEDERTIYNTDPENRDSDNDGLTDGEEVLTYKTNPRQRDSDFDNLSDYDETQVSNTNPGVTDTDGDGRPDGEEVLVDATDPLKVDSRVTGARATVRRGSDTAGAQAVVRRTSICSLDSLELFFPGGVSNFDVVSYPENITKLNGLLECLRSCPEMTLIIEGNASSDGKAVTNLKLSEKRAMQVYAYLVREGGIDGKRIIRRGGVGSKFPKISERRAATQGELQHARTNNRRVVVMIMKRCER